MAVLSWADLRIQKDTEACDALSIWRLECVGYYRPVPVPQTSLFPRVAECPLEAPPPPSGWFQSLRLGTLVLPVSLRRYPQLTGEDQGSGASQPGVNEHCASSETTEPATVLGE